jgi:hypothetical protein
MNAFVSDDEVVAIGRELVARALPESSGRVRRTLRLT